MGHVMLCPVYIVIYWISAILVVFLVITRTCNTKSIEGLLIVISVNVTILKSILKYFKY